MAEDVDSHHEGGGAGRNGAKADAVLLGAQLHQAVRPKADVGRGHLRKEPRPLGKGQPKVRLWWSGEGEKRVARSEVARCP